MINHHRDTVLADTTLRQAVTASQRQVLPLTRVAYKRISMANTEHVEQQRNSHNSLDANNQPCSVNISYKIYTILNCKNDL